MIYDMAQIHDADAQIFSVRRPRAPLIESGGQD
jgi:hypothetical protein